MRFQALLVSIDETSADTLSGILADTGIDYQRCSTSEAVERFDESRTDLLVLDFEDRPAAEQLIEALRRSSLSKTAVTLALLADQTQAAQAFGAGANFVLFKSLSSDNARSTLRAALALLQRERRRQFRVPVQLPVTLSYDGSPELEGIMLDLSEGGMDVLAAKPLEARQNIEVRFTLSPGVDILAHAQVVWANSNGQTGVQFLNFSPGQSHALCSWLGTHAPQIPPENPEPLSEYKLSDLSLGGCYIETLAPFPRSTRLDLWLRVGTFEVHLDGIVRIVYPGHGMGVEFSSNPPQEELVLSLIEQLTGQAGAVPDVLVWPKSINFKEAGIPTMIHGQRDPDDALVRLLRGESLSQEDFLAELRRQRLSQPEVTTA